jgi:hypothetical protein
MPAAACFALVSVLHEIVDRITVRIDFSDVIAHYGHYNSMRVTSERNHARKTGSCEGYAFTFMSSEVAASCKHAMPQP